MHEASDLRREDVASHLHDRAFRTFPAMLSTEAEALAWARQGAPDGAVVVAGYQASPRGRSGLSWGDLVQQGHGLGASVVLRPDLPEAREGWLYTAALVALCDVLDDTVIEWPDRLHRRTEPAALVGVQTEARDARLRWAVLNVLVPAAEPPRADLLARIVEAVETRMGQPPEAVLEQARPRCATLGRRVLARMLPLGSAAPTIEGVATDLTDDGGLRIQRDDGAGVVVLPQAIGFLEDPDERTPGPAGSDA